MMIRDKSISHTENRIPDKGKSFAEAVRKEKAWCV